MSLELELPTKYSKWIEDRVHSLGYKLSQSKKLAQHIEILSDYYNKTDVKQTPWLNESTQLAYACYFFPLNYLRSLSVINKNKSLNFFKATPNLFELGSGMGSTHLALLDSGVNFKNQIFLETSDTAKSQHKNLLENFYPKLKCEWTHQHQSQWYKKYQLDQSYLFLASYSVNELLKHDLSLEQLNLELQNFSSVLIIEPSTQYNSRQLLELRQQMIDSSKHMWAPCTHQGQCPLLIHSKKDWCHDSVFIKMPDWYYEIESKLKIKNNSLTYSYLMAQNQKPPEFLKGLARTIGNTQKEKGKTIQMICRGEQREFFSWLKKNKNEQWIERGLLVEIPEDIEQKNNELRVSSPIKTSSRINT
ncbi:MAG: hypothetical protein MK008_04500 [Bdellovibrionales bacterium]|nr:hypothetical protein [Bdellovibrionales bacterium]